MWIPKSVLALFQFNLDEQQQIREDLAAARAKAELLERQLTQTQASFNWLCVRVNDLENQNKALLEKALNIKVPAPQLAIAGPKLDDVMKQFSFDDIGDEMAHKLGLPT